MQLVSSIILIEMAKIFSIELLSFHEEIQPSCPDSTSFRHLCLNVQNTELGDIKSFKKHINYNSNFTDGHSQTRICNLEQSSPAFSHFLVKCSILLSHVTLNFHAFQKCKHIQILRMSFPCHH